MEQITDKIERLRKAAKVSKAELCRMTSTPLRTYYTYLANKEIPYTIAEQMLNKLGYTVLIVDSFSIV